MNINRISPSASSGECVIACKSSNGRTQCSTDKVECVAYATYIFQNSFGKMGEFYCNVLPYQSNSNYERPSLDETRLCGDFKSLLPFNSYTLPCRVKCVNSYGKIFEESLNIFTNKFIHFILVVASSRGHENKFLCAAQQFSVGCNDYSNFIETRSTSEGIFNCDIYNHGENFNYNRGDL